MDIIEALQMPENRLSKTRCTGLMDQSAAEINRLRLHNVALTDALRKVALVKTYKQDGKGGTQFIRAECEICEASCGPDQMIVHVGDCPLTILNPQQ